MTTKNEVIDKLWESSNHGTRREDVEAAYNAGATAERGAVAQLIDILLGSCTTFAGEEEYGSHHEHNLFDNIDRDNLKTLRNKLQK